jgi:hypothetical protein
MYSHPTFHNKTFYDFIMQNIKAGGYNSCTSNKEYPFLQIQEPSSSLNKNQKRWRKQCSKFYYSSAQESYW